MSRPDGWTASPELATPATLGGLRFADPDVEHDYRAWRLEHRPEARRSPPIPQQPGPDRGAPATLPD